MCGNFFVLQNNCLEYILSEALTKSQKGIMIKLY